MSAAGSPATGGDVALLAHQVDGDGEPLLLANGGMMTIAAWEPIAARLAQRYRVIRCDFRGQLLSPGPAPLSLEEHADDLLRLLDELAVERVHLLGASFGALVAVLLAARHPGRVRSLIAVTAGDRVDEALTAGARRMRRVVDDILAGGDRGRFHDLLIEEVYSAAYRRANRDELTARRQRLDLFPEAWFAGLRGILAATERFDLRPELPAVGCPTLVVVAGDDRVMTPQRCRALAAAIPGARLEERRGASHGLVAEEPEWLTGRCLAFLDEASAAG